MIRANFSFDIPLAQALMAEQALSLIRTRGYWAPEDSQKISFAQAFPAVNARRQDPDLAMAFYRAIHAAFEQGGEDARTQQGSLECEAQHDQLSIYVASGADSASYHYAIGVIKACQDQFGSPAVGFPFTETVQGKSYGGGVCVASDREPDILETGEEPDMKFIDQWILERLGFYRLGSPQRAAQEPEVSP